MKIDEIIDKTWGKYDQANGIENSVYIGDPNEIAEFFINEGMNIGFKQGYACALCNIIKSHGFSTEVEDSWVAAFGRHATRESLILEQIDEYDIETIAPFLKEINK